MPIEPNIASENVATITDDALRATCEFCDGPIEVTSRRRIRRRRFCRPLCRSRWHTRHKDELIAEAGAALGRVAAIIVELTQRRRRKM